MQTALQGNNINMPRTGYQRRDRQTMPLNRKMKYTFLVAWPSRPCGMGGTPMLRFLIQREHKRAYTVPGIVQEKGFPLRAGFLEAQRL